jgi:hypothetical protein
VAEGERDGGFVVNCGGLIDMDPQIGGKQWHYVHVGPTG